MAIINKYKGMKRIIITLLIVCYAIQAQAQLNASQIKKDGVTIVSNNLNQLVGDTVVTLATKSDLLNIVGGSGTVTTVNTGLGLAGGPISSTGTLYLDTANASVLSRQRAANTYQPIGSYLTSVDTTNIPSFYTKVRSLFSATAPATYSSGIIGVDTSTSGTGLVNQTRADNTYEKKNIYKVLESDGTSTNNVLVVASDGTNTFEFTADSASIYIIECWLNFTTSGSSGVILNISTVGTTTSSFSIIGSNNSSSAVRYQVINYNTSSASFAAFTSTETAYVHMQGSLITPGTGGLVQIRYRDNNAGQYVNAVKGSWMRVKQIK